MDTICKLEKVIEFNVIFSCETCINRTLLSKPSFLCPACKKTLKKANFQGKGDDLDPEFEREISLRKTLLREYIMLCG